MIQSKMYRNNQSLLSRVKWLVIIVSCFGSLQYVYKTTGYVPLVGSYLAGKELSRYKKQPVLKTRYDMLNFQYISNFADGSEVRLLPQYNRILDNKLSESLSHTVSKKYREIVESITENLIFPERILVGASVDMRDYELVYCSLYLSSIENTRETSLEVSGRMPAEIGMKIISELDGDLSIIGIHEIYFDNNGVYEIWISHYTSEPISYEKLLANTKKIK